MGWAPPDLVPTTGVPQVLGQPVSAIVMSDLESMIGAARSEGAPLAILSAFRSSGQQAAVFERNVERQFGRADGPISREEAEARAARFTARPGHSQHQLGTAIDFTTPEIGYGIGGRFGTTNAGQWLMEHSWRFGFIFPYTEAAQERSGYQPEPWHVRWVGRGLAAAMQTDGYLHCAYPIADDYIMAAYQLAIQLGVVTE
jgi:D-alanyl-D-alanine carboxypeptidase